MKSILIVLILSVYLVSCANMGGSSSGAPYAAMEQEFITDASPVGNPKTVRLSELAATLPIYESADTPAKIRNGEGGIESSAAWELRAEGSQPPVHIERLSPAPRGAQRIRVRIGPAKASLGSPASVWIYELERKPGGWKQLLTP